jgi:hypothetical protein
MTASRDFRRPPTGRIPWPPSRETPIVLPARAESWGVPMVGSGGAARSVL